MPRVIPLIRPRASRVPVRRAEAGERRDEVDAARRLDRPREPLALCRVGEDAEPVAQPLDGGAAREDGALERVAAGRGDRLQQAGRRRTALGARVREDEAARAVRRLRLAAVEAGVAEERRLLVAGDARDRERDAEQLRLADDLGRAHEPGQQGAVDAEELEQLVAPVERVEVEEHRPGRVGEVGGVDAAAGQLPDEPGVDRPERELGARHVGSRASSHSSLVAEKYGSGTSPVRARRRSAGSSRQRSAVRRSCQTIAGATGFPVARSQRTVVSRWFVIPIACELGRADAGTTGPRPRRHRAQSSRAPRGRARPTPGADSAAEIPDSRGPRGLSSPSTTRHVVPVVPWSIARITPGRSHHGHSHPARTSHSLLPILKRSLVKLGKSTTIAGGSGHARPEPPEVDDSGISEGRRGHTGRARGGARPRPGPRRVVPGSPRRGHRARPVGRHAARRLAPRVRPPRRGRTRPVDGRPCAPAAPLPRRCRVPPRCGSRRDEHGRRPRRPLGRAPRSPSGARRHRGRARRRARTCRGALRRVRGGSRRADGEPLGHRNRRPGTCRVRVRTSDLAADHAGLGRVRRARSASPNAACPCGSTTT